MIEPTLHLIVEDILLEKHFDNIVHLFASQFGEILYDFSRQVVDHRYSINSLISLNKIDIDKMMVYIEVEGLPRYFRLPYMDYNINFVDNRMLSDNGLNYIEVENERKKIALEFPKIYLNNELKRRFISNKLDDEYYSRAIAHKTAFNEAVEDFEQNVFLKLSIEKDRYVYENYDVASNPKYLQLCFIVNEYLPYLKPSKVFYNEVYELFEYIFTPDFISLLYYSIDSYESAQWASRPKDMQYIYINQCRKIIEDIYGVKDGRRI